MLKAFSAWTDAAAANFRWSRFAPTPDAAALCIVIAATSSAALLDRNAFGAATARSQLCAMLFVPGIAGVLRQAPSLVLHLFIHVDWPHLAGNLAFLLLLGSATSRRIGAQADHARPLRAFAVFCAFFAACGVAGGIVFVLMDRFVPSCTIGASGAIAGLLGAALRFAFRSEEREREDPRGIEPVSAGLAAVLTVIVAANAALFAAGTALRLAPLITAWQAHAGGLVFGALAFPWFARKAG